MTLRATDAARLAGMSYNRFRALVESGEIAAERDGRLWLVDEDSLHAWIAARRLPTRSLAPTLTQASKGNNVDLLDAVLARWDVQQLSAFLGVSTERIAQWRTRGVPNPYVRRLRRLADTR